MSWLRITNLKTGKVYDTRGDSRIQTREKHKDYGSYISSDLNSEIVEPSKYIEGEYDHDRFMAVRRDRKDNT